jgi:hypothetical protein
MAFDTVAWRVVQDEEHPGATWRASRRPPVEMNRRWIGLSTMFGGTMMQAPS